MLGLADQRIKVIKWDVPYHLIEEDLQVPLLLGVSLLVGAESHQKRSTHWPVSTMDLMPVWLVSQGFLRAVLGYVL